MYKVTNYSWYFTFVIAILMLSIFLIVFFNWNLTHVCVMICNNILCFGIWFMKTWALHSNTTWTFCIYYFFIPLSLNQMDTSTKWTPGLISVCFRWVFVFFWRITWLNLHDGNAQCENSSVFVSSFLCFPSLLSGCWVLSWNVKKNCWRGF